MNQDPLHCSVVMGGEEAVYGEAATRGGSKSIVCRAEEPLQSRGVRHVDPRQERDILQPKLCCLHIEHALVSVWIWRRQNTVYNLWTSAVLAV